MESVLDTLMLFGLLRIIPAVRGADEIACDAADALEFRLAHLIAEGDASIVRSRDGETVELLMGLTLDVGDVVFNLMLGDVREAVYRDVDIVDDDAAFSFSARRAGGCLFLAADRRSVMDYTTCSVYSSIGNLYIVVCTQSYPQEIFVHCGDF